MGQPIVMGDQVQSPCSIHLIPTPATGAPQPSPPLPFSAPLLPGLSATVTIGGNAAAVLDRAGPDHDGLGQRAHRRQAGRHDGVAGHVLRPARRQLRTNDNQRDDRLRRQA